VGLWTDLEDLRGLWSADRTWHPVLPEGQREALYRRWLRAVERALDWAEE
jgi:glycerol kinase